VAVLAANLSRYPGQPFGVGLHNMTADDDLIYKSGSLRQGGFDPASVIAQALVNKFRHIPGDDDPKTSGRYGFHSVMKALANNSAEKRKLSDLGLFGKGHALIVVFVSNEDDACSDLNISRGAYCENINAK